MTVILGHEEDLIKTVPISWFYPCELQGDVCKYVISFKSWPTRKGFSHEIKEINKEFIFWLMHLSIFSLKNQNQTFKYVGKLYVMRISDTTHTIHQGGKTRAHSGAAEQVKMWVSKFPWSQKSGYAKLSFSLPEAKKLGGH